MKQEADWTEKTFIAFFTGICIISSMKSNIFNTKDIAMQSLIAAAYVAITVALTFIGYGEIQFRISEFLLVLVFFNKKNAIGILIGTFIAAVLGPNGLIDVVIGTLATAITLFFMSKTSKPLLALLWPSIINGVLIGIELTIIQNTPLWLNILGVFIGEFVVTFGLGLFLLKPILNNKQLQKIFS